MAETHGRTPGTALAISGGGFRATLFHLGAFWRLNELGYLSKLKVITSVSGGSIVSGYLGYRWKDLQFNAKGEATNFVGVVVEPLRAFCSNTYDVGAGLLGVLPGVSGGDVMAHHYDSSLFHGATLQALPDEANAPRFIIYATSLQTGVSVRFSKTFLRDYKVGKVTSPTVPLAKAVAASSGFPPVLSPVNIDTGAMKWEREEGNTHFGDPDFSRRMVLTDGGVYDNMGLEAVWDRYQTVLVSDAGAPFDVVRSPSWLTQALRIIAIFGEQVHSLRTRWLIRDLEERRMDGAYWGIATRIGEYGLGDALAKDGPASAALAKVRTRLNSFSMKEQCQLINWGYALADAAIRRYVPALGQAPGEQPCQANVL